MNKRRYTKMLIGIIPGWSDYDRFKNPFFTSYLYIYFNVIIIHMLIFIVRKQPNIIIEVIVQMILSEVTSGSR
jgi:hypothetical protein